MDSHAQGMSWSGGRDSGKVQASPTPRNGLELLLPLPQTSSCSKPLGLSPEQSYTLLEIPTHSCKLLQR